MKDLKYNVEKEVSEAQFNLISSKFPGVFARRKENGKFYIKPMYTIKN